jgi:hypothetical protein
VTGTELIASQPRASQQQIDTVFKGIKIEDSQYVSQYGQSTIGTEAHQGVLDHLENSPIAALAGFMQQILMATKDTKESSAKVVRKSLMERVGDFVFGAGIEEEIVVVQSKRVLNANLSEAQKHADSISKFLELAAGMTGKLSTEASEIDSYVEAGRAYLAENTEAGKPQPGQMEFVNHRERFERRLSNLQTLYVSHLMSITQLKLAQAQAIDILDRFKELRDVLLPVYRQQQLASANKQFLNPEVARLAIQAHESIQSTVEKSLRGLPQTH